MNNENIFQALGVFLDVMRPFLVKVLQNHFPSEPWEGVFFQRLSPAKQEAWNLLQHQGTEPILRIDYHNLSFLASKFRDELSDELGDKSKTYTFENCMRELQDARNKCQHFTPLTEDQKARAFSNMILIANMLNMKDLRLEIDRLQNKHLTANDSRSASPLQSESSSSSTQDNTSALPSWFHNCLPHYDIRSGVLDESIFAANLNEVALGTGPEVYNNPTLFFAKTYITAGLRDIANRVIKALNGEETENRVISLQTGFGGGKTHTLISLYHIVKSGSALFNSGLVNGVLHENVNVSFDNAKVAVFTNNTTDVSQGRQIDDIVIHTLWGEIAYQLGGKDAYNLIRANDEDCIAPSSSVFKPILLQAGTSLILIDELADYCVKASAKRIGNSDLYSQTNSFIQTLTECVSSVPKCVLIATLPASASEVSNSDIGQSVLTSLEERIVRVGANVKPVDNEEVYEVVRRRLFEQINDEGIVEMVAKRYKDMYHNRRNDLPDFSDKIDYVNKIKKSYPFHPELVEMFRQRWGSDSRFQRTRGVLRLLASIVQDLWKRRDSLVGSNALIHTSDVNLENLGSLTGTITNLMGSQWETVMLADVYGASSNSRKIDEQDPSGNIGQYRLTQGISTTLLMASVGARQNKGLDIKYLKLCVLKPKAFNHNDVNGALNKLEQIAHYLYSSKIGTSTYWFESKANINILLAQAKAEVKNQETDTEILQRLKASATFIRGINVLINPSDDVVPELKTLSLVILHPKYSVQPGCCGREVQKIVEKIALKRGTTDRIWRNTIIYLLCSEAGRSALVNKIQDYLACKKILQEYGGRLEKDQSTEIQNRKHEYDKLVNDYLIRAFNNVVKYSAQNGIEVYELKKYSSDFSTQINDILISELVEEEWIIKSVGRNLLDKVNMLPQIGHPIKIKELYETFLRFDDKPMLIGESAVRETVDRYCSNGMFKVAFGSPNKFTKIYSETKIPFLDVTSDEYWLVDESYEINTPSPTASTTTPKTEGPIIIDSNPPVNPEPEAKKFRKVVISGEVPIENYSQLFSSFINTLKNNHLKIEIKFSAKSTESNPLMENSAIIRSVKESASQLGLDFEVE